MLKINQEAIEKLSPEDQKAAAELLEVYEQEIRANPLLTYYPHDKQIVFHESREPLKAFLGGNRSGKTTAGILDDLIQAVDADCLPAHLLPYKKWEPPFYCRIIVPDFTTTLEGVIFQKLREWAPKEQLVGGAFDKAYDKSRKRLDFRNGSWFDFMTFEQDLDKFGGAALHRVHYDEEPPQQIRKESMMRLIDYAGDELFTMTPLHGMSWMFDEIWEPHVKETLQEATVVVVDMDDNPYLDEKTKQRALAGLSEQERTARKSGRFVHFAGMIYDNFSPSEHIIREKKTSETIPSDAMVYCGIDPGIRNMAAVIWTYITSDDIMVAFEELALQGSTIAQVCEGIKLINMKYGQNKIPLVPQWYVIDPAARNVSHQTGRSDQMEFVDHGVVTIAGQNSVTAGINRVKERLETGRFKVTANCTELISEFRRYRWATPHKSENDPSEKPVKANDHMLDALRYVVMSRPAPGSIEDEVVRLSPLEEQARFERTGIKPLYTNIPQPGSSTPAIFL
jgi:phage terminase large subunit-like protein